MDFPRVRALYDYTARQSTELSFSAGQLIAITDIHDDVWWEGELDGRAGFVPAAYVEHAPADFQDNASTSSETTQPVEDVASESVAESEEAARRSSSLSLPPVPPPPQPMEEMFIQGMGVQCATTPDKGRSEPESTTVKKALGAAVAGRPDMAKALKLHEMKGKTGDLRAKKSMLELQAQVSKVKSGAGRKTTESPKSELEQAMLKRSQKVAADEQEKAEEKNMSELQRKFTVLKKKQ
eukprot:m.50682 g.50682  ORF g.50682 m.50682 type:complete len:238 (-) comp12926_c1_seq2:168-881(-)